MPDHRTSRRLPARITLSTHWTDLRLAAQAGSARPEAVAALQAFCERYRPAVYAIIRARHSEERAQDLTQQFFLRRIIERDDLNKLNQERGHFRPWLYTALDRFLTDDWRSRTSAGRDYRLENPYDEWSADVPAVTVSEFERHYAFAVAARALSALHARWLPRFAARGVTVDQRTLVTWLIDRDPRAIASALGIQEGNARQTVRRLYVQLWELLEADVADTVADVASVPAELAEICRILGVSAPGAAES